MIRVQIRFFLTLKWLKNIYEIEKIYYLINFMCQFLLQIDFKTKFIKHN